ncbi:YbjN domain-containing protein [Polaromonas naphthalenivorans]|nr:YbjN domain-containing protein [Polaromonas naphthalenivorans]
MSDFIPESDVTPVTLSLHLERAVVQHRLEDDEAIYVTEDDWIPFWIRILKKPGFVGFVTYFNFRKSSTSLQRLELANEFNRETYMSSAFVKDDILKITHVISYRDGLLTETLIRACRQFSGGISLAIDEFDPEYKILMRLMKTEPESESSENE